MNLNNISVNEEWLDMCEILFTTPCRSAVTLYRIGNGYNTQPPHTYKSSFACPSPANKPLLLHQMTTAAPTTTLLAVMSRSDLVLPVAHVLEVCHMRQLRSVSKGMYDAISTETLKEHEQKTILRNKRAEQLPNGAHRLRSPLGMHTLDVAVSGTVGALFSDIIHTLVRHTPQPVTSPILLVTLDGVPYVARAWAGSGGSELTRPAPWTAEQDMITIDKAGSAFLPGSTLLQDLPGGAWIRSANHGVRLTDGSGLHCTTVHLTLGQHRLLLICVPMPAAAETPETTPPHTRAELLPSGAFRLRTLDGRHTLLATSTPLAARLIPDCEHQAESPMLLLRIDGAPYIARAWFGNNTATGPAPWNRAQDFLCVGRQSDIGLFRPDSTILQNLMGGAWISRLTHDVPWRNTDRTSTSVQLVLDETFVITDRPDRAAGTFHLQLVCAPWPA